MKFPLVYVKWLDHYSHDGWRDGSSVKQEECPCHTVGWLFKEDEKMLTIIGCYNNEDQVGNSQTIIRSCITVYKVLRKGPKVLGRPASGLDGGAVK